MDEQRYYTAQGDFDLNQNLNYTLVNVAFTTQLVIGVFYILQWYLFMRFAHSTMYLYFLGGKKIKREFLLLSGS